MKGFQHTKYSIQAEILHQSNDTEIEYSIASPGNLFVFTRMVIAASGDCGYNEDCR